MMIKNSKPFFFSLIKVSTGRTKNIRGPSNYQETVTRHCVFQRRIVVICIDLKTILVYQSLRKTILRDFSLPVYLKI